eukprot:SAG11_NODE_3653_length_2308_cov_57.004074_1_plen_22_part_10
MNELSQCDVGVIQDCDDVAVVV